LWWLLLLLLLLLLLPLLPLLPVVRCLLLYWNTLPDHVGNRRPDQRVR
jgi:hypothetical protein